MTSTELITALDALCWSQAELARRAGVSVQGVNAWARDKTPCPEWLPRYLAALIDLRRAAINSGACKN